MPRRTLRAGTLVAALVTLVHATAPASAAPGAAIDEVTVNGGTATVTGTASFPAITAPQTVIGEETVVGGGAVGTSQAGDAAGLKLTNAEIIPLADGSGLRFIMSLEGMPAQVLPEAVRYTWAFKIGTRVFQLQAKSTNLASVTTTENPVGHVQRLASQQPFFQLRGACAASYQGTPSAGCYHLAWLNGSIDTTAGKVTMDLPFNTKDEIGRLVAPEFQKGSVLLDNAGEATANIVIGACFQAVLGTADVCRTINGILPYYSGPQVSLAVGSPSAYPEGLTYGPPLTLDGDSFTGTVSGLGGSARAVFVRACNGTECTYASRTVI